MIECNYSKACTETLKIIDLLSVEDFKKIPDNVIKILEENKDESYIFEYDYTKNLTNQNIENLTKAIISNLYKNYIANDTEKNEIIKLEISQLKEEAALKKQKYSSDNLFKKNQKNEDKEEISNNMQMTIIDKTPWYNKLLKKILSIFGIKN